MIERAKRLLSVATLVAGGCGGHVDLGHSAPSDALAPVTDPHELSAQTVPLVAMDESEINSLVVDGEFLYFVSSRAGDASKLWRCQKSNCSATLTVIASPSFDDLYGVRFNANRLGWAMSDRDGIQMCDVPDCENQQLAGDTRFEIWDESFGYWFEYKSSSLFRCRLADCAAEKTVLAASLPTQLPPQDFTFAGGRLYFSLADSIVRASVDGSKPAERLTLSNVTEWTASPLSKESASDVAILDMRLDGPYLYAALRIGNQNANQTLGCDTCKPGFAVARWRYAEAGSEREWILREDADVVDLVHLQVFRGEMVWGTVTGEVWSCLTDHCSTSKRQIGIEDAGSVRYLPRQIVDYVAIDEQDIFWLSVPCFPTSFDCSPEGHRFWTLKRTPRIPQ